MTANFDLWDWFDAAVLDPRLRASAEVVLFAPDGQTERRAFSSAVPADEAKSAGAEREGRMVAIEEFQLVTNPAVEETVRRFRVAPQDFSHARTS